MSYPVQGPVEIVRPFLPATTERPHAESFPVLGVAATALSAPGVVIIDTVAVGQHLQEPSAPAMVMPGAEGAIDFLAGAMTLSWLVAAYMTVRQYRQYRAYNKWIEDLAAQSSLSR